MKFRNLLLALVGFAVLAGTVVPANAMGMRKHHHHKHHKK